MRAEKILDALPIHFYIIDLKQKKIFQTNDPHVQPGNGTCFMQLFNQKSPCQLSNGQCLCEQMIENGTKGKFIIETGEKNNKKFFRADVKKIGEDWVVATYSDITSETIAAKEMKINNRRLQRAEKLTSLGSWEIDLDKKLVHGTEGACNIFGVKNKTMPADEFIEILLPEFREPIIKELNKLVKGKSNFNVNFKIKRPADGEIRNIQAIAEYRKSKNMVFGVGHDITERNQMIEGLEEARQKAEESDRLKSLFLANMSHEIRTPLNAILGFSNMICSGDIDAKDLSYFGKIIENSGQRLTTVIDDIIDISLIQSDQLKIDYSTFDINELLQELHVVYKTQKAEQLSKIDFRLQLCQNGAPCPVKSDKNRLYQVLKNLLDNAFKFTKEGFIEFGCSVSNGEIVLFVKDSGVGIDPKKSAIIFEPFRQVEEGISRKYEGSGLGLAIISGITERLGGKAWVSSEPGKGSAFYVSVPRNFKNEKAPAEIGELPGEAAGEIGKNKISSSAKTIVSFEDDPASVEYLKSVIKIMGFKHVNFMAAEEGIGYLKKNKADLVLMDVHLPGMNGYDATRIIKSEFPNLPVIIQTAYAMKGDRDKAFQAGCDDYLAKPVLLKDLKEKINKFVGQRTN
jgi:PAS domain S-box-containing protein